MPKPAAPERRSKAHRIIGVLFGLFFVAVALLVVAASESSTRMAAIAIGIVLAGLGLDLIRSSLRGRRSLLSRIGPLP